MYKMLTQFAMPQNRKQNCLKILSQFIILSLVHCFLLLLKDVYNIDLLFLCLADQIHQLKIYPIGFASSLELNTCIILIYPI